MGEPAPWHLIILVTVILLVFGAKRIPEPAKALGTWMREFKHGITGAPDPQGKDEDPGQWP